MKIDLAVKIREESSAYFWIMNTYGIATKDKLCDGL
jgi:hypothetical protein